MKENKSKLFLLIILLIIAIPIIAFGVFLYKQDGWFGWKCVYSVHILTVIVWLWIFCFGFIIRRYIERRIDKNNKK